MPINPALIHTNERSSKKTLLLACICALVCAGCIPKKRPAFSMSHLAMAHPIVPPAVNVSLADPPELSVEHEMAPRLVVPHGAPPKPHVAATPPPGPAAAEKPRETIIAPELSDEQISVAITATEQSLIVAERNLGLAQGKTLDAAQRDLISKIRGFVDSAREAIKENDWQRARTQAKKAEVLSKEFAPNP